MTAVLELMDRELEQDSGVPLAWYDVMVEVYRAPGHRIRMSELADRVLLSRSWITRRVRQLEDAGLLSRTAAPDDQRGVIASLTPSGLDKFRELERSHTASIERHFAAHMTDHDAQLIEQCFAAIAEQARGALLQTAQARSLQKVGLKAAEADDPNRQRRAPVRPQTAPLAASEQVARAATSSSGRAEP